MTHKQFGNKYIFRLDKGEELVESLKNFCAENKICLGTVSGVGAADEVSLGLFETKTKEYSPIEFTGDHEITSVSGNISQKEGGVYLHLHATIANAQCQAFGGHLSRAVISATFEGVIEAIDGQVGRRFNEEIGLNLLDF